MSEQGERRPLLACHLWLGKKSPVVVPDSDALEGLLAGPPVFKGLRAVPPSIVVLGRGSRDGVQAFDNYPSQRPICIGQERVCRIDQSTAWCLDRARFLWR